MTLFVDSSVWIDLFDDRPSRAVDHLARRIWRERIIVGDLVMVEVLQGYHSERAFKAAQHALETFEAVNVVNQAIAIQSAQNYRTLRARGITVRKTIDCLIATRCIIEGWPLLYRDRDFDPFVAELGLRAAIPAA